MVQSWNVLAKKVEEYLVSNPIQGNPNELYQPIEYTLGLGGKRIRPTLALMASELFGKEAKHAMNVALAVEIFHNFTLVHDDIMDEAPLRRGKTTVHKKWGRDIAILSGDVMMVKAYQYLTNNSSQHLSQLFHLFNQTAIEVCEGQQMDMNFETQENVDIQAYIRMIELKTAVLLAASLKLGAIVADADENDADLIYNFGRDLGIAFQIQDDYLDAFADPEKFGKRVGGDIIANKKTFLLLSAYQLANKSQKEKLDRALQLSVEEQKVEEVKQIFKEVGADQECEAAIKKYSKSARESLEKIKRPEKDKQALVDLAEYLMNRAV